MMSYVLSTLVIISVIGSVQSECGQSLALDLSSFIPGADPITECKRKGKTVKIGEEKEFEDICEKIKCFRKDAEVVTSYCSTGSYVSEYPTDTCKIIQDGCSQRAVKIDNEEEECDNVSYVG